MPHETEPRRKDEGAAALRPALRLGGDRGLSMI